MLRSNKLSRRSAVVGATAFGLSAPFVRGAYAAGKLSVGFGTTGCPTPTTPRRLGQGVGEKEKVEVQLDFITTQANKNCCSPAPPRSRPRPGHDILAHTSFLPARYAEQLVPVNELMDQLIKTNGAVNATVEYLGKIGGKWLAIPATVGSQIKGPCSRIDYMKQFAGIDVQAMYPAGSPPKADDWTLDTFLKAAEACHKGGKPFGIGVGNTGDSADTIGAVFHAYGAELVTRKVTSPSRATASARRSTSTRG